MLRRTHLGAGLMACILACHALSAHATLVTIDAATDNEAGPLGAYGPFQGSTAVTAIGQIGTVLLDWQNSSAAFDTQTLVPAVSPMTVSSLLTLAGNPAGPLNTIVFGVAINETGATGTNSTDFTAFTTTIGANVFSLGAGNTLNVVNYEQGQATGEAFITLVLPFDLKTLLGTTPITLSATQNNRDDGGDQVFLAFLTNTGTAAVPEASSLVFGSLLSGVAGLIAIKKRKARVSA